MSFTGNATYAELYPSRPSGDAGDADKKTYKAGSVFLDIGPGGGKACIYSAGSIHTSLL